MRLIWRKKKYNLSKAHISWIVCAVLCCEGGSTYAQPAENFIHTLKPQRERHLALCGLNQLQPNQLSSGSVSGTELKYDDGGADGGMYEMYSIGLDSFAEWAVRFTPPRHPAVLTTARIYLWPYAPDEDHEEFALKIFDDDGPDGGPCTQLGETVRVTATDWGWVDVDISGQAISIASGDFYLAYKQLTEYPDCEGLAIDLNASNKRSWVWFQQCEWEQDIELAADYMIRCVVELDDSTLAPQAPVIESDPATQAQIGMPYTYDVESNFEGIEELSYELVASPPGMHIDTAGGIITWQPGPLQAGLHSVTVQVSDQYGQGDLQAFVLSVVPAACVVENLFGPQDERTKTVRRFCDTVLSRNAMGRSLIALYYRHADSINAALNSSPSVSALAIFLLEAVLPIMELCAQP